MLRFFGEVTLTGDAVGASRKFWVALANSRIGFEIIVGIPTHYYLMQEMRIDPRLIPVDKTDELADWVQCHHEGYLCLLDMNLKHPVLAGLTSRISDMGIDPLELTTLPYSILVEDESNKGAICFRPNINNALVVELIREIKTIIIQRRFISAFLTNQR